MHGGRRPVARSGRSPTGVRRGSLDRLTATATGSTTAGTAATGTTGTGSTTAGTAATGTGSTAAAVTAAPTPPRVP
ncbi:hypothetical protein ABZX77_25460 [Streptomyces sp. NPDC004237]|uniref:hypothetical protein n=1 Tax=Streptomyces sp. NPDC004237 TaxID=3154455 RepID=UPI0033BEB4A0